MQSVPSVSFSGVSPSASMLASSERTLCPGVERQKHVPAREVNRLRQFLDAGFAAPFPHNFLPGVFNAPGVFLDGPRHVHAAVIAQKAAHLAEKHRNRIR